MVTSPIEEQTHMDRVQPLPATQNSHLFISGPHLIVQSLMEPLIHNQCQSQLDFLSHQQPQYAAVTVGFSNTPVGMTGFHPWHKDGTRSLHELPTAAQLGTWSKPSASEPGRLLETAFFKFNKCVWLKNYHLENDSTRSMCS